MKKVIFLTCLFLFFAPSVFAQEKCEAPAWKTGDQWRFKLADGNTYANEVVDTKDDLYVVRVARDPDRYGYDRETLNIKFVIKEDGRQMKATGDLRKLFSFPIFVGKKWTDTNSRPAGGLGVSKVETSFAIDFGVESMEDLTTPAGAFKTYKIRHKLTMMRGHNPSGWILFWYSPEAKWWVKREVEKSSFWSNLQDAELISFQSKK